MKMNKYFIALAGILTFGLVSCTNSDYAPYEPAQKESGAQVYFSTELPASYNLKNYEKGSFQFDINRVDASSDASIGLTVEADPAFTVAKSVTFAAGETSASVKVSWDDAKVVEATDYTIKVSVNDQTTAYGNSVYSFTVSKPASWIKWKKVHVKEGWWGEEEDEYMYYQDLGDGIRKCKIENCFDTNGGADPTDIVFTWNTENNTLDVEKQYMGWEYQAGSPVYFYDWYAYFTTDGGYTPEQLGDRDNFYLKNGDAYPRGYYDGNGGFYFNMNYYVPGLGGWTPDPFDLVAIAEGFVRTTDYNDDSHYGSSAPLFTGMAQSKFFSSTEDAVEFESFLRYTEPEDEKAETTTYYLGEYFTAENCLAFTAPVKYDADGNLIFEDGAAITDVENDQPTGIQIFGNNIWVSVKGGSVSVPVDGYPTFTVTLKVYCKDADGNKTYDFGTVDEVFAADGILKDGYTLDDVVGGYLEDYLGKWQIYSFDYFDQTEYTYNVNISDAGDSKVKIQNLTGFSSVFDDTVEATWNQGALFLYAQTLAGTYEESPIEMYLFDPDSEKIYQSHSNCVIGGICSDGALAFVNRYSGVNISGFAFYRTNFGSYATIISNVYGFNSGSSAPKYRSEYVTVDAPSIGKALGNASHISMKRPDAVKKSAEKVFSLSPVEGNTRSTLETSSDYNLKF